MSEIEKYYNGEIHVDFEENILFPEGVEKIIMTKDNYDRNVEQLLLEKLELQDRIDKAIEYLKDNACYNDMGNFNDDLDYDKCGDLLEILKGE